VRAIGVASDPLHLVPLDYLVENFWIFFLVLNSIPIVYVLFTI
jgi:hypothetical protein